MSNIFEARKADIEINGYAIFPWEAQSMQGYEDALKTAEDWADSNGWLCESEQGLFMIIAKTSVALSDGIEKAKRTWSKVIFSDKTTTIALKDVSEACSAASSACSDADAYPMAIQRGDGEILWRAPESASRNKLFESLNSFTEKTGLVS